jgi:hypothetical protein
MEVRRDALIDLVANTYGRYLPILRDPTWRDDMIARLADVLGCMAADGLIDQHEGTLRLTMQGRACEESPLTVESALQAVELLRGLDPPGCKNDWNVDLDICRNARPADPVAWRIPCKQNACTPCDTAHPLSRRRIE